MKLPIKKKYFDQIKAGKKIIEWRDAHITFICEETGETLRKDIGTAVVIEKLVPKILAMSEEEYNAIFEDETVIGFMLK